MGQTTTKQYGKALSGPFTITEDMNCTAFTLLVITGPVTLTLSGKLGNVASDPLILASGTPLTLSAGGPNSPFDNYVIDASGGSAFLIMNFS
jgi:hypothetical protein